eukprot:scaffold269413_cov35-Attheya_sp.AAC.1
MEFISAAELKAFLVSVGLTEIKAESAAPVLFANGYDEPDALRGISSDKLVKVGISDALAQALSNKLKDQQQQQQNAPVRPAWKLDEVDDLKRLIVPPLINELNDLGREEACDVVKKVARSNFLSRTSQDHGTFSILVVSDGHVRSGKTCMGIETPRLVQDECASFPDQQFVAPVYLKVDFLNGCAYDARFDTADVSPSVSLGGRLMYAFYGVPPDLEPSGRKLKDIPHEEAIRHIVETILQLTPENDNIVVPLICHFNEHGAFTNKMDRDRTLFIDMLYAIGSAATSPSSSSLLQMQLAGRFFIIPITTGISQQDANVSSSVSTYRVYSVPAN